MQAGSEWPRIPPTVFSSGRITEQTFLTLQSHFSGGATGALIPYVERAYGISYATVSLLFVFTFIGYVIADKRFAGAGRRRGHSERLYAHLSVDVAYKSTSTPSFRPT